VYVTNKVLESFIRNRDGQGFLTRALGHVAGPRAVDGAVTREQAGGVVALAAGVGDGARERQAVVDGDLGVPGCSRVSAGDH